MHWKRIQMRLRFIAEATRGKDGAIKLINEAEAEYGKEQKWQKPKITQDSCP